MGGGGGDIGTNLPIGKKGRTGTIGVSGLVNMCMGVESLRTWTFGKISLMEGF